MGGFLDTVVRILGWFMLVVLSIHLADAPLFRMTNWLRDETDSKHERSNMELYTDFGTGCQYLGRPGALIQRFDASGKQVCKDTTP